MVRATAPGSRAPPLSSSTTCFPSWSGRTSRSTAPRVQAGVGWPLLSQYGRAEEQPDVWFVPPRAPRVLVIGFGVVEKLSRYGLLAWVLSWSLASFWRF